MEGQVVLNIDRGVAVIEMNRPDKLNAVGQEMADALEAAVDEIAVKGASCAVLRGRGRAFCAGADLGGDKKTDPDAAQKWINRIVLLLERIQQLPCPLVSYVDGYALGLGASLAMAADLALATRNARFGFPEVHHGLVPGVTMALLAERVSPLAANEIIYFGERFDADRALQYGLVNRVVDAEEGEAALAEWLDKLASASPQAMRISKRLARDMQGLPPRSRMAAGVDAVLIGRQTEDAKEGFAAFREKRKPSWHG